MAPFSTLSDPADDTEAWETKRDRFLCAQAIMLAMPGVPGVYVHSLFGSHHDTGGFTRSGWKRDLNHERLVLSDIERRLADPESDAARVFVEYRTLLLARRQQPAFHPAAPLSVLDLGPELLALRRGPRGGQTIWALHNVTADPVGVDLFLLWLDDGAALRDVVSGTVVDQDDALEIPPYGVRWLATGP